MAGYRAERISELIHRELDHRLRTEIKDPRVIPISILRIDLTSDLRRAVIRYLPLGGGEESEALHTGLQNAAKRLRGPIGRALRLRNAPELVFVYASEHGEAIRVETLLNTLKREREGQNS